MNRAFVGLGSNAERPRERLEQALVAMEAAGLRVAAVATPVSGPFAGPDGRPVPGAPDVLNTVAEIGTELEPQPLLEVLQKIENETGRVRGQGPVRTLDLDLLDVEHSDPIATDRLTLPHPRALERAFVLGPWMEIAPEAAVTGSNRLPDRVLVHGEALRAAKPTEFSALRRQPALAHPDLRTDTAVLRTRKDLERWQFRTGAVALVPTMGALHAGHASLVRRARARDGEAVLATIFVNPLQFGPSEDFSRYPRTLDEDLAVLRAAGADAVYVPERDDVFPAGFSSYIVPEGPALGFEGSIRPGHFRGVATVVHALLQQTKPRRAWFGQKDAQQAAVIRRVVEDLRVPLWQLHVGPTVRDTDGLALSSRNRYLSPEQRAQALALPAALEDAAVLARKGERMAKALFGPGRARLEAVGLKIDYLDLVNELTFAPEEQIGGSRVGLVVAAVRAGTTRLLDNRWVVVP